MTASSRARARATAVRSIWPAFRSAAASKVSSDSFERVPGSTYESSAHSSCRLFCSGVPEKVEVVVEEVVMEDGRVCSGVPVSSSRKGETTRASEPHSDEASFLSRWPSSMVTVWKRKLSVKKASSARSVSYVVRYTSKVAPSTAGSERRRSLSL
eukprot:scaffold33284_cov69-Phaeocystis_antarctica.AAC.1